MSRFVWKVVGRLAAGGLFAVLMAAGVAHAQDAGRDPVLEELRARMDRLEKENADLKQRVQQADQHPTAAGQGQGDGGVTAQDVQKMVNDALEDRDAKTKKEAEAKKAEEDAKKKDGDWYQVGTDLSLQAKYKDGRFWIESKNKDFGNWIGGYFQQDWVWAGEPGHIEKDIGNIFDATYPRRARIDMFGYAWEQVEWGVELDFENNPLNSPFSNQIAPTPAGATFPAAGNAPSMQFTDMWVGLKDLPFLGTVRAGHVRNPLGLENYSSSFNIQFMERSAAFDAFEQEFMPGIQGFTSWCDQRLNFAWTLTQLDQTGFNVDVGNGDYAATASLRGLPIWRNNGRCLLHLAADYQYRSGQFDPNTNDHDVRYRARPDIHDEDFLLPRFVDTGVIVTDRNDIFCLEGLFICGPFWIQSEFTDVLSNNCAVGGKNVGDLQFQDFYIQAGYFLTGESLAYDKRMCRLGSYQPVIEPFFWVRGEDSRHHWGTGAWEILARYDVINLNSGPVRGGSMETYTVGLNWYLNTQVRVQLNYVAADREVDQPKQSGLVHFFGTRVQFNF